MMSATIRVVMAQQLIVLLFLIILVDLEVSEFVALLVSSDDTQPVTEVVLLQVLLGQVLEVPDWTLTKQER